MRPSTSKTPTIHYRGSGFLQFWTVSVIFNLDKANSKQRPTDFLNGHSRFGIFSRHGHREIGIVLVHPDWAERNIPGNHEFILLCEGRDERTDESRIDHEQGWKYKMMLIEWHGDWAERVAIASIYKTDLNQAFGGGPVWKEIILG